MSERNESFWMKYINYCVRDKLCPSKYLIKHIRGRELCCPVEAIRREHWKNLLDALSTDNNLSKVHFASCIWPHSQEDHSMYNLMSYFVFGSISFLLKSFNAVIWLYYLCFKHFKCSDCRINSVTNVTYILEKYYVDRIS